MTIKIIFDGSMQQKTSGACFEITARDQDHARSIAKWLRDIAGDEVYIAATLTLEPQEVFIQV